MAEYGSVFNPSQSNTIGAEAVKAENVVKATKPTAGVAGEVVVGVKGIPRQVNIAVTQKAAVLKYTLKHNLGTVVVDVTPLAELAGPKYEQTAVKKITVLNENEVEIEFAAVVENAVFWFAICG